MIQSMLRCSASTARRALSTLATGSGRNAAPRKAFFALPTRSSFPEASVIIHHQARSYSSKDGTSSSSSDSRYESTGEYDTQDKSKRIGNPIQWANPYDGPTVDDNANPKLQWVLPVGCAFILAFVLWSRWRGKSEKEDEELIGAPKMQEYDMKHHSTPAFSPIFSPPPPTNGGWTPSPPPS